MRCIATSDIDGANIIVELANAGQATAGATTVQLTPTGAPGVFEALVDDTTIPVFIWGDGIDNVYISLRGYTYEARVLQEHLHGLLSILQSSPVAKTRVVRISAPMPGLLKAVLTAEGAQVRKGDALFTLEAMKMENIIKSPIHGVVHAVSGRDGFPVEKGTILCLIEPSMH